MIDATLGSRQSWRGGAALGGGGALECSDRYEIESYLKGKLKFFLELFYNMP